ncbi:GNAT family N-acetyltransferase [Cytobacillus sp. Hz8]|uniref:GNAT family N-acetyltransferase n=1 Tax=Cytobacillus sp. Hz8 TaxID=3347168 RepID=UPI0035E042B2
MYTQGKISLCFFYKVVRKEKNDDYFDSPRKVGKERIGHISLGRIDRRNQAARIGKVLVGEKEVRGQGIGQKMLEAVLKIAFDELHLHRVSLGVFDFNYPAIACYERVGFKKEGLLRDSSKIGDSYWNMWEMSILEDEWKSRNQMKE